MTVRGAKPLPTKLKLLRGTLRKGRANASEPSPAPGVPVCPGHLSEEAKRQWDALSVELHGLGLLTRIDGAALALLCEAWARWVEAEDALRKYGIVMRSPSGFPMQSPYLAIANKAMEQIRALLAEFGMSPASRTRVSAAPVQQEDDPLEALLRRRREHG